MADTRAIVVGTVGFARGWRDASAAAASSPLVSMLQGLEGSGEVVAGLNTTSEAGAQADLVTP